MTAREKFEALISAPPQNLDVTRFPDIRGVYEVPGGYMNTTVALAWELWQASREQALEEALLKCSEVKGDEEPGYPDYWGGHWGGAEDCEEAIRQLIKPEGNLS